MDRMQYISETESQLLLSHYMQVQKSNLHHLHDLIEIRINEMH